MKRRDFFKLIGVGATVAVMPINLNADTTNPRVVVVGGGFSGRTVAKYLKMWGGSSVDVVLIDRDNIYTSPILSNLVLNGQKSIDELKFGYSNGQNYGINFINRAVISIDRSEKRVVLDDSSAISYDKLVLATGVDFIPSNSYDFTKVPHAWIAGEQITLLKNQIETLRSGDRFIMSIPKSPYRCPPGPYERACVVADYLKNIKGLNVEVVVLDENSDIIVEKDSFMSAFNRYGVIYKPNSKVLSVDDNDMIVRYLENGAENIVDGKVLNIIPNQKASALVVNSGLVDESNFAPVNLKSYKSMVDSNIHIVGDSHKSTQPKAGHIANVEAKICADAILRELNGFSLYPKPKTNSACYSPLSSSTATWLTAVYEYNETTNSMEIISKGAGAESSKNYSEMFNWSGNLFSDTFS